jgi:hypothetical protein
MQVRFSEEKKKSLKWKCVLIFSTTLSETFFILRRIQRNIIIKVNTYSCKVFVIFVRFNRTRIFSEDFRKKSSNIKFHQNKSSRSRDVPCRRREGEMEGQTDWPADRQTNVTKLTVAFRSFSNAPKKPVGECCIGQRWLLDLRTKQNKEIHYVGRTSKFWTLYLVARKVVTGRLKVNYYGNIKWNIWYVPLLQRGLQQHRGATNQASFSITDT